MLGLMAVAETGEARRKGARRGGGSPGLHESEAKEGRGHPPGGLNAFTLAVRQGLAP